MGATQYVRALARLPPVNRLHRFNMLRILHVLFRPKRLQLSAQLIPGISFWLSGHEPPKPGTSKIELLLDLLGDLIHLLGDDIHRLGTPEDGLVPLRLSGRRSHRF